jgi:hypothetical protein
MEGEVVVLLVNARHIKYVLGRKTDIENSRLFSGFAAAVWPSPWQFYP